MSKLWVDRIFGYKTGLRVWVWLVKNRRRFLNRTVFFSLFVFVSAVAIVTTLFQFPLQFADAYFDAQMKLAGGRSTVINQFRAINKNTCVEPEDCQCVLFIHGLGDQALTWRKLFKAVAPDAKLNLYAIDLPGAGSSKHLEFPEDYSATRLAAIVKEDVFPLCESWTIVGNSFGGWVATRLALMSPAEVNGLLLVGSAGLDENYDHIWPTFAYPTIDKLKSAAELTYARQRVLPDFVLQKVINRWESMSIKDILLAQTNKDFVDADLRNLSVPVRLFWGQEDQVIPLHMAKRFEQGIPQSELTVKEGCGHVAQQECPGAVWEELQKLLQTMQEMKTTALTPRPMPQLLRTTSPKRM